MDELEWKREDSKLTDAERDLAVDDLIALVGAVDGLLQLQSEVDVAYFAKINPRAFAPEQLRLLRAGVLGAYRWQYIISGVQEPRFGEILSPMITEAQSRRIGEALLPIIGKPN
jgi:hypothetical protein